MNNIRNFSIIAHIDHGKSTLADRFLEHTGTIEKRKMREQVLDTMELERERGITIKMQPVRMRYRSVRGDYILNLIDTPGHIDFSYEVSRALSAVEGAILLVDATRGVQAQTLSVLESARALRLTIVPAVSKVDSPLARINEVKEEVARLLSISPNEVLSVSGRTGGGVAELLECVVDAIPPPRDEETDLRALVFDFSYSDHRGIIVYVRVFDGSTAKGDRLSFAASGETFTALEVGTFAPDPLEAPRLSVGEIGYIVTGIKKLNIASVGDTVRLMHSTAPVLPGYRTPRPLVWASFYPRSQDDFFSLRQALERLHLTDASLSFEEEASGILGRGFRCGLLGMLHLEIVSERLRREYGLDLVVTTPTVTYEIHRKGGSSETIFSPAKFPDDRDTATVLEPVVDVEIITPSFGVGQTMQLLFEHEGTLAHSETFGSDRVLLTSRMPLRELMRGFFDKLKSLTAGFASVSYKLAGKAPADVVRLDLLVAEEVVPSLSRVVSTRRVEEEAKKMVERLHTALPRQQFVTKIQARGYGRILASKALPALRKDVTGYLYGGDITRKRKLWEKQKKGKKRLLAHGKVTIPTDVFLSMLKEE